MWLRWEITACCVGSFTRCCLRTGSLDDVNAATERSMFGSFEFWCSHGQSNYFSTIASTTDCVVAIVQFVIETSEVLVGNCFVCGKVERFRIYLDVCEKNESFWSLVDRFCEFQQDRNPVCYLHKNHAFVFVTSETVWPTVIRWVKPEREKQRVCVERCLLSCVIWGKEQLTFVLERKAFGKIWPR